MGSDQPKKAKSYEEALSNRLRTHIGLDKGKGPMGQNQQAYTPSGISTGYTISNQSMFQLFEKITWNHGINCLKSHLQVDVRIFEALYNFLLNVQDKEAKETSGLIVTGEIGYLKTHCTKKYATCHSEDHLGLLHCECYICNYTPKALIDPRYFEVKNCMGIPITTELLFKYGFLGTLLIPGFMNTGEIPYFQELLRYMIGKGASFIILELSSASPQFNNGETIDIALHHVYLTTKETCKNWVEQLPEKHAMKWTCSYPLDMQLKHWKAITMSTDFNCLEDIKLEEYGLAIQSPTCKVFAPFTYIEDFNEKIQATPEVEQLAGIHKLQNRYM